MKHLEDIRVFIDVLLTSEHFHALVIESPPGWGKTSVVNSILNETNRSFHRLGTYTTAYHLYTTLKKSPDGLFVIDDCCGLLGDSVALAVLKSATWPIELQGDRRLLMWGSGEATVEEPTPFSGKVILLVNSAGFSSETQSFLSRTLYLRLLSLEAERIEILRSASKNEALFPNQSVAAKVLEFFCGAKDRIEPDKVNLRALRLGYELATKFQDKWETLAEKLLTGTQSPPSFVKMLSRSGISVEDQVRRFRAETGMSRRTFFNYKLRG